MPLKKVKCWVDSKDQTHATLEHAQTAELSMLLGSSLADAAIIVSHADAVLEILHTTRHSRPMARKVNGGKKPRKGKLAQSELAEQPTLIPQPIVVDTESVKEEKLISQ